MKHLISQNYHLAYKILLLNIKKLKLSPKKLQQYDEVIREQETDDIIEIVPDIPSLLKESSVAFLAHNGVFRNEADTTKCRIVFLSNLKEKSRDGLSHNETSSSGSNLNNKLAFALTLLRFDQYLLIFDICKAFLQIQLSPEDQAKLMFLWVKDVYADKLDVVS